MRNIVLVFLLAVVLAFSAALPFCADAMLSNNIAYSASVPVTDAAFVPDASYADTVVMYIKSPLLDDYANDDLSSASGSCYMLWRDGKLFIHLVMKNVSSGDTVIMFFDLDNSDAVNYESGRTVSLEFTLTESTLNSPLIRNVSGDADTRSFLESMISAYNYSSENGACIELCLDFSTLYKDFSFADGARSGFELMITDNIDSVSGTQVRYVWNDDTGDFLGAPESLGTLIFVNETPPDNQTQPTNGEALVDGSEKNPGTSDVSLFFPVLGCLSAFFVVVLRRKA